MPKTSFYDVIVVGGAPAGLMTAGLLRRRKYRVLGIGQGMTGNRYLHEGTRIPATSCLLPPYGHAPSLDAVLKELGVEDPVHPLGKDSRTGLQIVTPTRRLTLAPEQERLQAEIERATPQDAETFARVLPALETADEAFKELLRQQPSLQQTSLRERSRRKRALHALENAPVPPIDAWPFALRVLVAAASFQAGLGPAARSDHATVHLVLGMIGGMRLVPSLYDLLADALHRIGVDFHPKTVAEEIFFDGRTPGGVTTLREAETYKGASLVTSLPIRDALEMIPLRRRHKRFRLWAESVRPALSLFSLNLAVPDDALPLGMGRHLLLVRRPGEPLEEDNLIQVLCQPFPGRDATTLMTLGCLVPYRKHTLGREYLGPLHTSLLEAACWLVPFLQDHLQGQSSPFWASRAGDEGHPTPWSLHQVLESEQEVNLGTSLVPLQTPYRNLFHCGPASMPGLGIEGAAYAARQTADLVASRVKLKDIL